MKKVLNQGVMTSVQRWGWGGVGEGSPETVSKAVFACVRVCAHACVPMCSCGQGLWLPPASQRGMRAPRRVVTAVQSLPQACRAEWRTPLREPGPGVLAAGPMGGFVAPAICWPWGGAGRSGGPSRREASGFRRLLVQVRPAGACTGEGSGQRAVLAAGLGGGEGVLDALGV